MKTMPSNKSKEIFELMMAKDFFSQWMGIKLMSISEGHCQLKMIVKKEMLNGFGILHGGVTFAFADSAFAFASNSYGKVSVSLNASMTYSKSAKEGDLLIAEATKLTLGSRTGTFDVTISNIDTQEKIALFRGTVFRTEKEHKDIHIT